MNCFKRLAVACLRFRHRHGYGIHSPVAFDLITSVIYGESHYYAYDDLQSLRRGLTACLPRCSQRVDELLFRLVNLYRPECVVEVGTGAGLSICYMSAAKKDARCVTIDTMPQAGAPDVLRNFAVNYVKAEGERGALLLDYGDIDLLHIAHTHRYEEVFEEALLHASPRSVFVVEGIHESRTKRDWWRRIACDERTGVTFDLYDLGLVFFDKLRPKQHYIS